jgi:thioredoxin 1
MLKRTAIMNTQERAQPAVIPSAKFTAEVLDSKWPTLVEFWAPWSRKCRAFEPDLQEVALACAGKVKVIKVNTDDSLDLCVLYDIQSVPTLLYFKDGNPRMRIRDTSSKDTVLAELLPLLQ